LVRCFAFAFGASAMWALLSVVVARRLHLQSGSYAVMLSWLGAGAVSGALLIGKIGHRLNLNRRVLLGSLVFVGTNLALALVPSEYWLFPVMFISGTAWLITMTSFSTSVQLHVPRWVQARVVSVYMLVFQAGLSLGSIVWGELADRTNVSLALLVAAGWMLAGLALALPFPMHQPEGLDFSPAEPWSDQLPALEEEIDPDDGPVVVMIEYDVALADHAAFRLAAQQLTPREVDWPTVRPGDRLRGVAPVKAGVLERLDEAGRGADVGMQVGPAGLQQQHSDGRVGREPVGEHAAGRPGTDDDIVVRVGHGAAYSAACACIAWSVGSVPATVVRTMWRRSLLLLNGVARCSTARLSHRIRSCGAQRWL
ncbi:MAG: MFS transporter, partial [Hymenobacter sp.]